jgi:hypothetical protein
MRSVINDAAVISRRESIQPGPIFYLPVIPAVNKKSSHRGSLLIFNLISLITVVIAVITAK